MVDAQSSGSFAGAELDGGRYRIDEPLDAGGMGVVWMATQKNTNLKVVVKFPHQHVAMDDGFSKRFQNEIQSLIHLSHKHNSIVTIIDVGEYQKLPYVIMQYLGGKSLAQGNRGHRMLQSIQTGTYQAEFQWLIDIADVLDFIFRHQIIHRDVKPQNIIFDDSGKAHLADFGIAKAIGSGGVNLHRTMTDQTIGTLGYMAHELIAGNNEVDGRADQYSLAVTLYEVLCGQRPFTGETPYQVGSQQSAGPPQLLSERVAVTPEFAKVVNQGLAKDREHRFDDCRNFAKAILKSLESGNRPQTSTGVVPPKNQEPTDSVAHSLAETSVRQPAAQPPVSQPPAIQQPGQNPPSAPPSRPAPDGNPESRKPVPTPPISPVPGTAAGSGNPQNQPQGVNRVNQNPASNVETPPSTPPLRPGSGTPSKNTSGAAANSAPPLRKPSQPSPVNTPPTNTPPKPRTSPPVGNPPAGATQTGNAAAGRPKPNPKLCCCPWCWKQFPGKDVLWVAEHQSLYGDVRFDENELKRFLPDRYMANGYAVDPMGEVCSKMACPNCHLPIPVSAAKLPLVSISVLGESSSGKSCFLASMTWQLRKTLQLDFQFGFTDADTEMNQKINNNEKVLFMGDGLARLMKTDPTGDGYRTVKFGDKSVTYLAPYLFNMQPSEHHPNAQHASRISNSIALYDNAGESFRAGQDSGTYQVTRHLLQSDATFFIFDPTQHQNFRNHCKSNSNDLQMREGNIERQEIILSEVESRLKRLGGLGINEKYSKPFFFIVNKFDAWARALQLKRLPNPWAQKRPDYPAFLNLGAINQQSTVMRDILSKLCPEVVAAAERFSNNVTYIPISSFGRSIERDQSTGMEGVQAGKLNPMWVEVPFLCLMSQLKKGVIPTF